MIAIIVAILSSSHLFADGFSGGNKFVASSISGSVQVTCYGRNPMSISYFCNEETLDPYDMDYFVTDQEISASHVELKATHADGSTQKQTRRFSTKLKRSRDHFNLWIMSLTQRPLLEVGANQIKYKYKNGDDTVSSGQFEVMVEKGGHRECRPDAINTADDMFCSSAGMACREYFDRQNYCQ